MKRLCVHDRVMTSHDACTRGTSWFLKVASLQGLNLHAVIPAPADCDQVFERKERSADRKSSSALPGLWPHTALRSTHSCRSSAGKVLNHSPPYSPDLAPSDFHLFLHLTKFLFGQRQRFQNDREAEMSVTQWFQSQAADFYNTGYKRWSHGMTNVSIPEANMLKNSSTLGVNVPINLSLKLGSVSENVPRILLCGRAHLRNTKSGV